ncbi:putative reverse transcriptase domain-containing protein [Tanacetum coccineum]|uniref:Reverse transcriptase domain-containing protein n=1 Tax=Tanacetum coccineum TaxID=301880 RepID=A0ABQ4WWD6_9ASTR
MNMILQSSIKDRILAAQKEAVDEFAGLHKGLDEMIEQRSDGTLYYLDRIWVPLKGELRTLIMDEAHKSKYSLHLGADKMYYELRDRYWWPGIKKDTAEYRYIKNHKKTVKNGQTRTRETKEYTRNGRAQEKPKIQSQSQEKSTLGVHWAIQVKYNAMAGSNQSNQVLSLAILSIKATWLWKKAQGEVGFTLGSLREVAQAVTSRMTAWQSLSVHT